MAEVAEAAPPAEVQEAEAAAAPLVDESYDESLLIKVKGKVKRPERPDDTERNMQVSKLQEQIENAMSRIKEIKGILDSKNSGGRGGSPEQQAIRQKIQELRNQFSSVLTQKKRLQTMKDEHNTDKDKAIAEQRSIRDSVRGPLNLETLEAKVEELEFKLTHESLSAQEEKRLREQKDRLDRQDRPNVLRFTQLQARIDAAKAAVTDLRGQIAEVDTTLNGIKAAQEAEQAKIDALRQKEEEQRSDVPALIQERKDCWEVVEALKKKQQEIRAAFELKWQEFKKVDKAYKGWLAQERKKRDAQRKAEYEERVAARKARDEGHKPVKYEQEVFMCEQVISYLKKYVTSGDDDKSETKAAAEAPEPGMKLLKKKDAEGETWGGMGGSKKGKGARKAAEKEKVVDKKSLKLQHTMETLQTFWKLGVPPPNLVADVPATLEAMEAKRKEFEEKREKAKTEPEPEEEPAAEEEEEDKEATANGDAPHANGDAPVGGVGVHLAVDDNGAVKLNLKV